MTNTHHLQLPVSADDVRTLRAGDLVYLHGEIVFSAGLPTHQRMLDYLAEGKPLPIGFEGGTLFHLGSFNRAIEGGFEVLYINPTTSTRFNAYMPPLIRQLGVRLIGGKGGLDMESTRAMQESGCAYLSFLGGGSTLLTAAIKRVIGVVWEDMLFHYRLVKVEVAALGPLTVGIDAQGNSLYEELSLAAHAKMPEILRVLAKERERSQS